MALWKLLKIIIGAGRNPKGAILQSIGRAWGPIQNKEKKMKGKIILLGLLCGASASWAALVTDDFSRDVLPVDYTSDTSQIGPHWKQNWSTNEWSISSGASVYAIINKAEAVLYNDELQTTSGGGDSFTLKLDYAGRHNVTVWGGVAWNYQDANNFYCLRYKNTTDDYQLLTMRNGSWANVSSGNASAIFADSALYTFEVASSNPYEFTYSITERNSGSVVASGTYNPAGNDFSGGYAGIYQSNTGGAHTVTDNFSLEVIPEPATLGLMGVVGAVGFFIRKRFV